MHTMAETSDDSAPPPPLLVLRDHFQLLHDRAISEAKEHEPLFTVRWRLRDSEGRPVAFQRDGHRFTLECSIKLLQDEAYMLEIEIEDVGHTLTALGSRLLVLGGREYSTNHFDPSLHSFNVTSRQWREIPLEKAGGGATPVRTGHCATDGNGCCDVH